ncbi:MAG: glycosyl transferase family 1, partial [Verrucomicrobiaceae bacterium]
MRIAIVVTSGGTFGKRGFYNRQEVGLARGLSALGHIVEVHKTVPLEQPAHVEVLGDACLLRDTPQRMLGNNGWFDSSLLASFSPDAVIMFTDTQLSTPYVARWCDKNGVPFLPYVGIM